MTDQLLINEMEPITNSLKFFLNFTTAQSKIAKRFDSILSVHGIGLNDFMILFHLTQAHDQKLRRIDLAEKIGLTASGVTRMLVPMEKVGLVTREANERDARVSYVKLTASGERILSEAMNSAEATSMDLYPNHEKGSQEPFLDVLIALGGSIK